MIDWKDDTGRMSWFSEALIDALAATFTLISAYIIAFLESPIHTLLGLAALAFAVLRVANGVEEYRYRRERRKRLERMWK